MSFRTKLTLFFLLIVVLPMVAVAVLVSVVADDSRNGKADARLAGSTETALAVYEDSLATAREDVRVAGRDPELADAIRDDDAGSARDTVERLRDELGLVSLAVLDEAGDELAFTGSRDGVAAAELDLRGPEGPIGALTAAAVSAEDYAAEVQRLTGGEIAVLRGNDVLAATVALGDAAIPDGDEAADLELGDEEYRVDTVAPGGADSALRVALMAPRESGGLAATPPLVAGALAAFFAIALFFIVVLLRALQGQVREMFDAARRVGDGDFSQEVPVEGDDEMAGLAREFNKMSGRLSVQMDELRHQRVELERSVQRIGEAFASGLDRRALLEIVADTALGACDASASRVVVAGRRHLEAESGDHEPPAIRVVLGAAIGAALADGQTVEVSRDGAVARAELLTGLAESKRGEAVLAVAKAGVEFDDAEREMLRYLCGQAAVSVENIDLHEFVSEQAVRDELTGLANQRRFRELIEKEAVRAERFNHPLSLVMLDLDDFKQVNDTHGHLQGDEVLRAVGRVLAEESRGVDEPARYGGEEFIVALPETEPAGALEVAERIREAIESTRIPRLEGEGEIGITASLGVASTTFESAADTQGLIAAADAALYRAKRSGKNCTVVATEAAERTTAQGQPVERRT